MLFHKDSVVKLCDIDVLIVFTLINAEVKDSLLMVVSREDQL